MPQQRKIIHIDMDCFYAAVEQRDHPELQGLPVAVGGSADGRGVLCTASYEARKFGVRSAMPTATALRQCPDLVLRPVNMPRYKEVSRGIHRIFSDYTDLIEPLSLDEAYLDVSDCDLHQGSATQLAEAIRARIYREQGITASAGISVNKFVAKVASDWNKPNGQCVVAPSQVDDFVAALPVGKIFGVGKVTERKLQALGLRSCADIRQWSEAELSSRFGSFGSRLFNLAHGVDNRPVSNQRQRKSISVEHTYREDLPSLERVLEKRDGLLKELRQRALKSCADRYQIGGLYAKVKFSDFTQTTVARAGGGDWQDPAQEAVFAQLLEEGWRRGGKSVRLLGVGYRLEPLDNADALQINLF